MALPFVWMLMASLRTEADLFSGSLLPRELTLGNFERALQDVPWTRYYLNGAIATTATFLGQVVLCVPAAYALARLRFRGSRLGLWLVLACLMVPPQITAVPVYVMLAQVGLVDTRTALVLPFLGSAFGIFLFRQFLLRVPDSVFEAARLDGAGHLATLWDVVVPALRPAIVSFAIFSFTIHWNDYFWPSVMLRSDAAATVPYGVVRFTSLEAGVDYGTQMAAATLAVLPLVVAFVLAHRRFIAGLSLSTSA